VTFVSALRELWKRKVLVAISVVIALAFAILAVYQVGGSGISKKGTTEAHGSTQILIDSARSPIAGSKRDISGLISRAGVFARLMAGGDVVAQIAEDAGVDPESIQITGPAPLPGEAPGATEAEEALPYGLTFTEEPELPIVSVVTRAPTVKEAAALAEASPEALRGVIKSVQEQQATPAKEKVEVRVLGPPQAQLSNSGPGNKMAVAIFFFVLALGIGLILGVPRLIAAWRREDHEEAELAAAPDISEAGPALLVPHESRKGNHLDRPGRVRQH
jgi:capsular polysaccharide biosynthesis protein